MVYENEKLFIIVIIPRTLKIYDLWKRTQLIININTELLKELKVESTKESKPLGELITSILQKYTNPISKDTLKTIEKGSQSLKEELPSLKR